MERVQCVPALYLYFYGKKTQMIVCRYLFVYVLITNFEFLSVGLENKIRNFGSCGYTTSNLNTLSTVSASSRRRCMEDKTSL